MRHIAFLRLVARVSIRLLLCGALVFLGLAARIVAYSFKSTEGTAQAAIVLVAAAWGNQPSPVYRERLNEAIRLYREGRVSKLIFTGGTPNLGYPPESSVARGYAEAHGVPSRDILVDGKSRAHF